MPLNIIPSVPHKGWELDTVIDLNLDEGFVFGEYEDCEFCGQEQIRYVHLLSHADYSKTIRVGCICSERLTDDYVRPRRLERSLRNRASRRQAWLKKKWKLSRKGNTYLKTKDGFHVGCFEAESGGFRAWIGPRRGRLVHPSIDAAKLAIFDALDKIRNRNLEHRYKQERNA